MSEMCYKLETWRMEHLCKKLRNKNEGNFTNQRDNIFLQFNLAKARLY